MLRKHARELFLSLFLQCFKIKLFSFQSLNMVGINWVNCLDCVFPLVPKRLKWPCRMSVLTSVWHFLEFDLYGKTVHIGNLKNILSYMYIGYSDNS